MRTRRTSRIAALAAALALAGCATEASRPAAGPSLYDRVGGKAALSAVVDDAVHNIATDKRINQRFGNADIPRLHQGLVDLLCVRTGGPCTYTGLNMADAHEGMNIRGEEFDALVEDMMKSIDKLKVPARERAELLVLVRQMKASVIEH